MHFPWSKKRFFFFKWAYFPLLFCLFGLILGQKGEEKKTKTKKNKNRVPSILGLRLKVTVILLIYWKLLQNTKTSVFKQIRELKKPIL